MYKMLISFPATIFFRSISLARGIFTVELMKLKLQGPFQGPGKGLSSVFTWSYVFTKFAKARYFYYRRLNIIEICHAFNSYFFSPLSLMFMVFVSFFKFVTFCDFFPRYK